MKPGSINQVRFFTQRGLLAFVTISGILLLVFLSANVRTGTNRNPLVEIRDIQSLRALFNHDAGRIRLVMILNPG